MLFVGVSAMKDYFTIYYIIIKRDIKVEVLIKEKRGII